MRYFFHIGYNGFNYHGWQKQLSDYAPPALKGAKAALTFGRNLRLPLGLGLTIQQVLEDNLSKLLKIPASIIGCGRTDAQVHAKQYFFHLNSDTELNEEIIFRLNKMLPEDIAVFDIIKVADDVHAQYNAVKRTYDYFIHTCKDPFLNHFSCLYLKKYLDTNKMKQVLALLPKYKDYRAFCKSPDKYEHTICNVSSAKLFSDAKGDKLRIQISSNRFLRGMIRAIVAKLLQIGGGEMSVDEYETYLISKETRSNLEFAPPQGLYLSKVVYPFLDIPARTEFSPFFQGNKEKEWQLV